MDIICTSQREDSGRVECNDVDCIDSKTVSGLFKVMVYIGRAKLTSTHLLGNHHNTRSLSCTTEARHGENLIETNEHVVRLCKPRGFQHLLLLNKGSVDQIQVPSSLQRAITQAKKRLICLTVLSLGDQPAWGFGTEIDS